MNSEQLGKSNSGVTTSPIGKEGKEGGFSFLEIVAKDLYQKFDGDFRKLTVVFPNKRASLFFNQYLLELSEGKPLWTPQYLTITDLFSSLSELIVADPILLVCYLHAAYLQVTGKDEVEESLDRFYSWGEMMLADFEDVDANMAPAELLFKNLEELDELTRYDYLSEEQKKAIQQFFRNFDIDNRTMLKDKFQNIWNQLLPTYQAFRQSSEEKGFAYGGMLQRKVIDALQNKEKTVDAERSYAIIGFNVLTETEKRLFKQLKADATTYFYWDFDNSYFKQKGGAGVLFDDTEAGQFIRKDIELFGSELPLDSDCYNSLAQPKHITYISSPTENAQSHYVSEWLKEVEMNHETLTPDPSPKGEGSGMKNNASLLNSAIVLCNESILPSVLHSIPTSQTLNITMGFPLQQTPIASFVLSLLDLQIHGVAGQGTWRYSQVASILKHPYAYRMAGDFVIELMAEIRRNNVIFPSSSLFEGNVFLRRIFTFQESKNLLNYLAEIVQLIGISYREEKENQASQLDIEAVFNTYTIINRLINIQSTGLLKVKDDTLTRLLRQIIQGKSVPFHGEPAVGLQVMGVLETRNLDFKHLLMLSVNEGNLPKSDHRSSFIPYNLREAYGMTTIEKQNSLYAYYFYRLLQRAENITLMYNNSTEGLSKGEMSRFMMQLLVERGSTIVKKSLSAKNHPSDDQAYAVKKTDAVMQKMKERFTLHASRPTLHSSHFILSPSSLNAYLDCPLKFYFHYVAGMKPEDEVSEEVENNVFGSIFHYCMEQIYSTVFPLRKELQKQDLLTLSQNNSFIASLVDEGFCVEFFKLPKEKKNQKPRYNGEQRLKREVIITYVKNQLLIDAQLCPMQVLATETNEYSMLIDVNGMTLNMSGAIDRIDLVTLPDKAEKQLRIVDYKTSANEKKAASLDDLFDAEKTLRPTHVFQTFYYANIMTEPSNMKRLTGNENTPLAPALMYIKLSSGKPEEEVPKNVAVSMDQREVLDFKTQYKAEFNDRLHQLVSEIFNPQIDFTQNRCQDHPCIHCNFIQFCEKTPKTYFS